ncbi:hypothetical protein KY285_035131 [Solanum tuberosum]|nr:hypothetical protein KY285_035131 [Solanum tuberosum]
MGMQQRNGTRGDVVLIGKSGHPLVINATIELALDPANAKVVADGVKHDARGVEYLVDNMSQQLFLGTTAGCDKYSEADEEEEQGISPPMQKKLSPTTPAFVPSNNKMKHGRKHSWDGKLTEEFVPRHLPMRLAKQNHMTVSTTSTRSNKANK